MQPRNWFEVGLRLIGVWEIVAAIDEFVAYGNILVRLSSIASATPNGYLSHGVSHLLIGAFLLFAAGRVVDVVYPPEHVVAVDSADPG